MNILCSDIQFGSEFSMRLPDLSTEYINYGDTRPYRPKDTECTKYLSDGIPLMIPNDW